jgi:hypothetical protein
VLAQQPFLGLAPKLGLDGGEGARERHDQAGVRVGQGQQRAPTAEADLEGR